MAIELRGYQHEAVEAVRRAWRAGDKRVLMSMPTGCGKCTTPDTLVWSGGLRTFGELREAGADTILTPAGMRRIEGWHDDGVRDGLKITTDSGLEIDGTPEHRVWCRTQDGQEDWRRLRDFDGSELVALALGHADWGDWDGTDDEVRELADRALAEHVVPTEIKRATWKRVIFFLNCLLARDLRAPLRICTPSERFARELHALAIGLGYTTQIDREAGMISFQIVSFVPLIATQLAWTRVRSIEPSRVHRIDCSVEGEHCYVGNGVIHHNTWVFVFIIYFARENGLRCLVLVNTDELVQQTVEKLERVGVSVGIMKAGKNEWMKDVVVASVQTLSKATRLYNLPPNHFGLVITDECHYANAPSYQRVLWYFRDAWHLGVTATPFRGDKKSLAGAGWDSVAYVYPLKKAIEDNWLSPVQFVTVHTGVEITGVSMSKATLTSEKDFNARALEKLINTEARNDKIVDAAVRHLVIREGAYVTRFRRTIAFCAGVAHAVDLANAFRRRGVEAFAIYGSLKPKYRRMIIKAHQKGLFPVLCNCNILTHGYDDPLVDGLIMARPTNSKVLYLQQLGRGLRVAPGTVKTDCLCLDVADVAKKHALTIGAELMALEDALDERGEAQPPAGLVPAPGAA